MKKSFLLLLVIVGLAIPLACSNNNNPTSPAPTATPTTVPTNWAGYTNTATPSNTPTGTATATNVTATFTGTPTSTPSVTPTPTGPTSTPTNTLTYTPTTTATNTLTPFPTPMPAYVTSIPSINHANGVAFNAATNFLYVAQGDGQSVSMVQIFNASLGPVTTLTSYGTTVFGNPSAVAVNSAGSTFYVLDEIKNAVYAFSVNLSPSFSCSPVASWTGYGAGTFSAPEGIAVDSSGNVYVTDTQNNVVDEFGPLGANTAQYGGVDNGYTSFGEPSGIAVAGTTIFVADSDNEDIRLYSPFGTSAAAPITTIPGADIFGIAVDSSGNVYAADSINGQVEQYSGNGLLSTGSFLLTQWSGSSAPTPFISPDGVALTGTGNIWVADYGSTTSSFTGSLTQFQP